MKYYISYSVDIDNHISEGDTNYYKSLCEVISTFHPYYYNLEIYSILHYPQLCKKCLSNLPVSLQEDLKFNYIVRKLKNK